MSQPDGGPAFPRACGENDEYKNGAEPGMSLRDYFAGQAMIVLMTEFLEVSKRRGENADDPVVFEVGASWNGQHFEAGVGVGIAEDAYLMAELMVAEKTMPWKQRMQAEKDGAK